MSRTGYPLFQTGAEAAAILDKAAAAPTHDDLDALREEMGSSSSILQSVYPVGAIYISTVSTDPATLFGFGTWERIQDRFLLAAGSSYAAGSTGGEATHTLTVDEMPSHSHKPSNYKTAGSDTSYERHFTTNLSVSSASTGRNRVATSTSSTQYAMTATTMDDITGAGSTNTVGGGAAHNNMPPYLAVYMWRRVS